MGFQFPTVRAVVSDDPDPLYEHNLHCIILQTLCLCDSIVPLPETIQKISALESELARLKAQIAIYALSEVEQMDVPPGMPRTVLACSLVPRLSLTEESLV